MEIKKIVEGMTATEVAQVIDDNFKAAEKDKANKTDVNASIAKLTETVETNKTETNAKIDSNKEETDGKLSELGSEFGNLLDNAHFIPISEGIEGINDYMRNHFDGCTIKLEAGEYTNIGSGTEGISFNNPLSSIHSSISNVTIYGVEGKTIINRANGSIDVYANREESKNNVLVGITLKHGYNRDNDSTRFKLKNCVVKGSFFDDDLKIDDAPIEGSNNLVRSKGVFEKIAKRGYIVLAAADSSEEAKASADLIADTINNGINLISSALSMLGENGGRIFLRVGTYKSSSYGVSIKKNNVVIEGESLGVVIDRDSGGSEIYVSTGLTGISIKNVSLIHDVQYEGSQCDILNCKIKGNYYPIYRIESLARTVHPSLGIDGINNAIYNSEDGATVYLEEGTYEGDSGVTFWNSGSVIRKNITIIGKGKNTIISRNLGYNDVFINNKASTGNVLKNLCLAHSYQDSYSINYSHLRFIDCWIGDRYENSGVIGDIINVGAGCEYETLSKAYTSISQNSELNRYEIHVWGHIKEEVGITFNKPYVSLIGHNAIVEFAGAKGVNATFGEVDLHAVVRDIRFIKTGCYNYWDEGCVNVSSNYTDFINCTFENNSSSPSPFTPSSANSGLSDVNGSRRHGITITIRKYGDDCQTYFYNCKGIGSPFGFQNTRGWYISYGSPKLYNCVGVGGGIGDMGHGFISHRSAQAIMYNCIGIGSPYSWQSASGFRFQAEGSSKLYNCIGYGGRGVMWESKGVSAERLSEITTDGVVDYSMLTNNDVQLVEMGEGSKKSNGFSIWTSNGCPELYNCVGYSGSGVNSSGLEITACGYGCKPIVNGGYFGLEKQEFFKGWVYDSGKSYSTFKIEDSRLNKYTPYIIDGVTVSVMVSINSSARLFIETDEETPTVIVDGYELSTVSSIGLIQIEKKNINAGVGLKAYILDSQGNYINDLSAWGIYLHILWSFNSSINWGVDFNSGNPQISNAEIIGEFGIEAGSPNSEWIIRNCNIKGTSGTAIIGSEYVWRMFNCVIDGNYPNDIRFAGSVTINNSTNISITV